MDNKVNKLCVYYHGLGGSAATYMKDVFKSMGYYLVTETVDFYEEWLKDRGKSFIESQIKKYKKVDLIVGLSFGGHVAYVMSKATGADLLLINPAVNRKRSKTGIGYYVSPFNREPKESNIEVYFGEYDYVVPMQYTQEFLQQQGEKYSAYLIKNMMHDMYYHEFAFILKHSPLIKENTERKEKKRKKKVNEL